MTFTLDVPFCGLSDNISQLIREVVQTLFEHWWTLSTTHNQANSSRWPSVDSMLGQRRWRWANIESTLGQRLVFAGILQNGCDMA